MNDERSEIMLNVYLQEINILREDLELANRKLMHETMELRLLMSFCVACSIGSLILNFITIYL